MEEMYESWTRDPKSVHASWDAYFRGSQYVAPPTVGTVSKRNECKQHFFYKSPSIFCINFSLGKKYTVMNCPDY